MASKTEICNMAIGHIGVGKEIANVDTESSEEASACRRYYEIARDKTLREFPWPFAKKIVALGLIEEFSSSTAEWKYSYRYPSDCEKLLRIKSGIRNDNRQSRVPYKILKDSSGRIIYTDKEDAECEYIERATDPEQYPSDFVEALSYKIAYYIVPRIGKGDLFGMKSSLKAEFIESIDNARETAINEQQDELVVESEFIRDRT